MRILTAIVVAFLGSAALLLIRPEAVRADAPGGDDPAPAVTALLDPAAAQPGTDADAQDYARREAESPEAREFVGGSCEFAFFVLFVAAVVFLILYLQKENKI